MEDPLVPGLAGGDNGNTIPGASSSSLGRILGGRPLFRLTGAGGDVVVGDRLPLLRVVEKVEERSSFWDVVVVVGCIEETAVLGGTFPGNNKAGFSKDLARLGGRPGPRFFGGDRDEAVRATLAVEDDVDEEDECGVFFRG